MFKTSVFNNDQIDQMDTLQKEMSIIREMQFMRKEGIKLQDIANTLTNKHRKKFVVSWVHKLLNREEIDTVVDLEVA